MALVARYDTDGVTVETWGGSSFPTKAPREGKIQGMNMKADQGTVGMSAVPLPDPTGDHVLRGLRRTYWAETDGPADNEVIYDGYLQQRDYGRDEEHFTGSRRLITVNLVDLNTLLGTYLVQGAKDAAHGFRPDETNIERIQWALGSAFLPPINDFGGVATTGGVDMDGADLRGQNMANVIRDAAAVAGWQHFLYYDETEPTVNRVGLFFNPTEAPFWSSTLRFSNHPGDADDIRLAPGNFSALTFDFDSSKAPIQHRSPDTVYSGVIVEYDGGKKLYVDCEEIGLTTKDDYYVRQTTLPAPNIKTEAKARAYGYQFLRDHDHEQDTASVRILLPSSHAGLIKAGHRAQFRFDHFEPEYRTFQWWRVQDLTWAQKSRKWYWFDLELEPTPATAYMMSFLVQRGGSAYGSAIVPRGTDDGGMSYADGWAWLGGTYSWTGPGEYPMDVAYLAVGPTHTQWIWGGAPGLNGTARPTAFDLILTGASGPPVYLGDYPTTPGYLPVTGSTFWSPTLVAPAAGWMLCLLAGTRSGDILNSPYTVLGPSGAVTLRQTMSSDIIWGAPGGDTYPNTILVYKAVAAGETVTFTFSATGERTGWNTLVVFVPGTALAVADFAHSGSAGGTLPWSW